MGTSSDDLKKLGMTVEDDNEDSDEDKMNNVFKLGAPLESGRQYFWRVDAKVSLDVTYKGDVWSFKTGNGSLTDYHKPSFRH